MKLYSCFKRLLCLAALIPFLSADDTHAWGATGHMITAQVAYEKLEAAPRAEVDRLISLLAPFEPALSSFTPAATWMDALKGHGHGIGVFSNWHFLDQPFNPYGLPTAREPSQENIVWAIESAMGTFKEGTEFEKALMLRMLIHFVGDIHQPLHCATRYSVDHPQGDLGGNDFAIIDDAHNNELHAYWDNTAGLFDYISPSGSWEMAIKEAAAQVKKSVTDSGIPVYDENPYQQWANESYSIAVSTAYAGIEPGDKPDAAYQSAAQAAIQERLAWGGYRLAALLNEAFAAGKSAPGSP